jgi:hypothetical protein
MASNPRQPRLRVNRTATLSVNTTWQKIDFSGTSNFNVNTYGKDPTSGNQMVMWDSSAKIFRFYNKNDQNYIVFFNAITTVNLITTRATLRYRFVVPNGISAGVNLYFPFPDTQATAYVDAGEVTLLAGGMNHNVSPLPLYVTDVIRNNGLWLEIQLSNSLITLGTCTLNSCDLLIQSTK